MQLTFADLTLLSAPVPTIDTLQAVAPVCPAPVKSEVRWVSYHCTHNTITSLLQGMHVATMPRLPTWREQARLPCASAEKHVSQYTRYG